MGTLQNFAPTSITKKAALKGAAFDNSVGYIKNIHRANDEIIYTVVVSGKSKLRKQATIALCNTLIGDGRFLKIRDKGVGAVVSIRDTLTFDTTAMNKPTLEKIINNLADSVQNLPK